MALVLFTFMKNRLRTFIAISLSTSVLTGIEKCIRTLQSHLEGIRWVETKNLHVTLKFLGDVPLNDLPQLIRAVTQSTNQTHSFDLTFHGLGVFPHRESPKTIWIGCQEGSAELAHLAEIIDEGLLPLGFPKESRRFSPHLTIGRVKKLPQGSALMPRLDEQSNRQFGSCSVSEVLICSSELTRHGPLYDELAAIPLR
jgi:2'-5' RNA ligase